MNLLSHTCVPLGRYASSSHFTTASATSMTNLIMVVSNGLPVSHFYPYCFPEWVYTKLHYCLPTLYRWTRWRRNFLPSSRAIHMTLTLDMYNVAIILSFSLPQRWQQPVRNGTNEMGFPTKWAEKDDCK